MPKPGTKWDFLSFTKIEKQNFCTFLHEVTAVWRLNINPKEPFSENVVSSFLGLERGHGIDPRWDFSSFMKNWLFRIFAYGYSSTKASETNFQKIKSCFGSLWAEVMLISCEMKLWFLSCFALSYLLK